MRNQMGIYSLNFLSGRWKLTGWLNQQTLRENQAAVARYLALVGDLV
jgi:hypothetical protein